MSFLRSKYLCLLTVAVAMTVFTTVMAQSSLTLSDVQRLALPADRSLRTAYESNPAAMSYRDSLSVSDFTVKGEWADEEKPVMEQEGDGRRGLSLGASSYAHLGERSVVWGAAAFLTGSRRNVRWTDCIDYRRVGPYVLGDEAGGNLSVRRYTFSGGYAHSFGRWTFGAEGAYRAEIAYRNVDPRVKTVVSDLDLNVGATFRPTLKSMVGLTGGLKIYNQSCDLDFYNPANQINTYTLTGLGTYYHRFMGNTNKNSGYKSLGYHLGLQWLPVGGNGLRVQGVWSHYRMEQQLRSFNNITLGYTDNDELSFKAAYAIPLTSSILFSPEISGSTFSRKGTENLFGTSAGASYDKIGSRTPYSHDRKDATLLLPLQFGRSGSFLTLIPSVGWSDDCEKYTEPYRRLSVSHLTSGLTVDWSTVTAKKWLWNLTAGGNYAKASAENPVLTDLDTTDALGRCIVGNYEMLSADRAGVRGSAGVSRPVSGFILSCELSYNMTDYINHGLCHYVSLTISAKF